MNKLDVNLYTPNNSVSKDSIFCMYPSSNIDSLCLETASPYTLDSYYSKVTNNEKFEYYIFYTKVNYILGGEAFSGYLGLNFYSKNDFKKRCDCLDFHGDKNTLQKVRTIFESLVKGQNIDNISNLGRKNVYTRRHLRPTATCLSK